MKVAQEFKDKVKRAESAKEKFGKDKDEAVRYTHAIEQRLKDVSRAEEDANNKVLTLLTDVEQLTEENQRLLECARQLEIAQA